MTNEKLSGEVVETPTQIIERFIAFTKAPYTEGEWANSGQTGSFTQIQHNWTDLIDKIYGNEEMLRISKDEKYIGIPDISGQLEKAFVTFGTFGLVDEFYNQLIGITLDREITPVIRFFDKVATFQI